MRIYKLEKVIPPPVIPGTARPAMKSEESVMHDFYGGFNRSVHNEEPDPETVKKQVDRYLKASPKLRGLWFWEVNGQPVSMVGYAGPTPNGIRIGAVYTPPEHRNRGYASALTAALSEYLLEQGYKFCFLFTDLLNPTSNHIYQQIGYTAVCDVDRYLLD
jgi:predicted GNAT family acetyltransferase